jgi:RNA polymerase sigma factor (sigma-70 family)
MSRPDLTLLPDEALVRLAVAGRGERSGAAAATELFGRYRRRAYAWCWRRVGSHEQALDLAQDALLQAWRGLDSYSGEWLFVIVRNRCRTAMRPRRLVRDEEVEPDSLTDPSLDVLDAVAERLDRDRVLDLMRRVLDAREQDALWMRAMEGMSVDEITRALGVDGRSGARGLLQTARRKLRAALRDTPNRAEERP